MASVEQNKIVKYDNALNTELAKIEFQKFKPVEQNLFFAICSKMKYKSEETVAFTFQELKELGKYDTGQSKAELFEDLDALLDKLQDIKLKIDNGVKRGTYTLFPVHELDRATETAQIQVGAPFVHLLNDFDNGGWTRYELNHFTQLDSRYSKTMFRILKRWRMKGVFTISVDRLRVELSIPGSYAFKDINRRVLGVIEKELSPMFENFKITRHKTGRKITSITFSFKKENAEKELIEEGENQGGKPEKDNKTKQGKNSGERAGKNTVRNTKTEILPGWVGQAGTETPLSPEDEAALSERIAKLKSTRTKKE